MIDFALLDPRPIPKAGGQARKAPTLKPPPKARRSLLETVEESKYAKGRLPSRDETFAEAWAYETSRSPLNAAETSRRGGKTTSATRRHVRVLGTAPRGSWTHFGSLIRRNAKKHFWRPLKKQLRRLGWEYKADESDMILEVLATGNFCQAFGCDDESGTNAPQGDGSALFTIDEAHLAKDDVLQLLYEVAEPMLIDGRLELEDGTIGGMFDLIGLPPRVKETFFAKAIDGGGWKVFKWHMFRHDFPKSREEKLAQVVNLCERNKKLLEVVETLGEDGRPRIDCGPNTDPEVAWKYFGVRTTDVGALAYKYARGFNDYDPATVDFTRGHWVNYAGIDLGWSDADAIVIGKKNRRDRERRIHICWQWRRNHTDVLVLADIVRAVKEVFRLSYVVGDHGGHGATAILETIGNVLGLVINRKPQDVLLSADMMNDDYQAGRLLLPTVDIWTPKILAAAARIFSQEPERLALVVKALMPNDADLATESGLVQRSFNPKTKRMEIGKKGFHSDITEAARMMHSAMLQAPAEPLKDEFPGRPTDPEQAKDWDRMRQLAKQAQGGEED